MFTGKVFSASAFSMFNGIHNPAMMFLRDNKDSP
jgi:hypothetical protein